jgi:acetylornithine deacetylase
MADPVIEFLRGYVAIPSVNPMGRTDQPAAIVGEGAYAAHLQAQLAALSVDVECVGASDRPSVVAEVRAADPGADTVLVASHLDTVPVDGMEIAPFDPVIEGGRLYGRGSCDTKAGMAALLAALEKVLQRGVLRRNLILVGEADEELGSLGVRDVLAALGPRRPAWVLATEPTELRVVNAHKGVVHVRMEARGVACHASNPSEGKNAVILISRAAVALDALAGRLSSRVDPRLGPATLSVGVMSGGHAPNVVPDRAYLVADRRLLPGETLAGARAEFEQALADAGLSDSVELASCSLEKPTLSTALDHPAVTCCARALRKAGQPGEIAQVAFGTDAGVFEAAGLPGVVLGPGSILRAHTAREYVEIDQVEAMVDFFVELLSSA